LRPRSIRPTALEALCAEFKLPTLKAELAKRLCEAGHDGAL